MLQSRRALPTGSLQADTAAAALPQPSANFDGMDVNTADPGFLFLLPPDPNIDVGPNHVVQMVNSALAVYSKTGTKLFGPIQINSLWSGFGGPCETSNDGDPIVQYDQLADRWLVSQFTGASPYYECIAISQTPNPAGAYFRYAFFESNTLFHDYPHFGVWPDGYYMSTNLFDDNDSGNFAGASAIAFERDKMLAGNPAARMVEFIKASPFGGQLPSDLDGTTLPPAGSPNYFVEADDEMFGTGSFPTDRLNLFKFHVDWANTANSTFTGPSVLDTAPFDSLMCVPSDPSRNCIPQEGTAARLDAISDRLMYRLSYRNLGDHEALVVNHTVDIDLTDHAGIRWYELRKPPSATTNWGIHQQGTYAGDTTPDVRHRWMASMAMDKSGDIGVGYSISGVDTFPSLAFTGRKPTDPLGTLPQGETTLFAGTGSQNFPVGRWGDYSSLVLDPSDDCTFWYTNEYYNISAGTNQAPWRTRIGAFKFPTCGAAASGADLSVTKTDSPDPVVVGTNLTYHVTVSNNGPDPAAGVTLTDTLPPNTTLVSVNPGNPTCRGTTTITCNLGALSAGSNAAVDIVVTPSQTGTVTNSATASSSTTDPNAANNSASAATSVIPVPALKFGPATLIDSQRTEGEPLNFVDGNQFWQSGPFGTSTQQAWIHRSVDGGDQWNVTSPVGLRSDNPPGGGDSDIVVDDQGFAYFADLELANVGVSVTNDGGNNWRKNPAGSINGAAVDRQWMAVDNGPTPAASDNTVFLTVRQLPTTISQIYSSAGSTGSSDQTGGILYQNTSTVPLTTATGAPCGQLHFDPVNRNLFLPCVSPAGSAVNILKAHVAPSQRTGLAWSLASTPVSPGGAPGNFFPLASTDTAGNLYITWTDASDHHVYYTWTTTSKSNSNIGSFSAVRRIDAPDANTNVFHWAKAGAPGRLAVAWYGNPSTTDPSDMDSWFTNRSAAAQFKWYGYVSMITNANSASPNFEQTRFTEKPMHYGQICLAGTLCTEDPESDRTMADFMAMSVDSDGALRMIYNDTTNQHNGAQIFEERQLKGPSLNGGTLDRPVPANNIGDAAGDAQSPHYSPTGTGANLKQYDLTAVKLSQPNPATLRVEMKVNDLSSLSPPTGKTNGVWLTRFQALSTGQLGEESYRIFYVGAESANGAPLTFFAGSGTAVDGNGVPGNGCVTTTPKLCKLVQYPNEASATGTIIPGDENSPGDTIRIDVPLQTGFGPSRPISTSAGLYNVTALTMGRNNSTTDLYADLDATRSFDYPLGFIGGTVYNDANGNGVADGDSGLANVTVFADLNANGSLDSGEPSTVTSASGAYALSGLAAGTYSIDYVVPAGFGNSGVKPRPVVLSAGEAVTGQDFFAQQRNAAISGTVYNDANGNGVADNGETGLAGVLVFLDGNANGSPDTGEAAVVTGSGGGYSFTGLAAGNYRVDYVVPSGYANTRTPKSRTVTLAAGQVVAGIDFFAQQARVDLSITKTDSPDPVGASGNITYHITVTNTGPGTTPATGVTVTDVLPGSVTFVSSTATCSGTSTVTCLLGSIASGSTASADIVVKTTTPGSVTNTASVSGNELDPNTANNSATASTTVTEPNVDLSITKTDSPDPVGAGGDLTYHITVRNAGPGTTTATGVRATDVLPTTVTFVSSSASQGTCSGTTTVTCLLGSINSGSTATADIVVKTTQAGTLTNTASVSGSEPDPTGTNNSATATTTVNAAADLAVVKTGPATAHIGAQMTYTITVTNNGPSTATGVTVTDTLPKNTGFGSASPGCAPRPHQQVVVCDLGTMASGATVTVSLLVKPTRKGDYVNTATVSATSPNDPVSTNNRDSVTTIVSP